MRKAEKFSIHKHVIKFDNMGETYQLVPFGDVHHGAPMFATEHWDAFIKKERSKSKSEQNRTLYLGMGDYLDLLSSSERAGYMNARLHESSEETIEDLFYEKTDKFIKDISFMEGRLIGMLEGNHHVNFVSGITSTQYACHKLKCPYLGYSSFIKVGFQKKNNNNRTSIEIMAHHGTGGGGLPGSSFNSLHKMLAVAHANIYLMGHNHAKGAAMESRLELVESNKGLRLGHKKIILGRTGSFLKAYEPEKRSYVAKAGMRPTDLGVIRIDMTPRLVKNTDGSTSFVIDLGVSF